NTPQQVTTWLSNTTAVIVLEDLQVAGMLHNHQLAHAIAEMGLAAFRRQLRYQAAWYGSPVVLASRPQPTSTTCSAGGWYDTDLALADRVLRCQQAGCGQILDRDLSVASTVAKRAGRSWARQTVCGVWQRWPDSCGVGAAARGAAGTQHVL